MQTIEQYTSAEPTQKAVIIRPQPGPQSNFLTSEADVVLYGGAAGGGKTYGLLLETVRHIGNPGFGAVIFRRTSPQITNEGGLWDEASNIYPLLKARSNKNDLIWRFPSGAKVAMKHLQHEDNKLDWQGSQIPLICFDELTHFTQSQFFYLLSRNRSTCGVKPYVRATTNPSSGSWVKKFLAPWLDKKYHDPAESGEIRYFIRSDEDILWGRTRAELVQYMPKEVPEGFSEEDIIKSCTYISASIYDNKILMTKDPSYLGWLLSLPEVERQRLLMGDWDASDSAYFSEFSEAKHVHKGFIDEDSPAGVPMWWHFFGGLDWGKANPFAFELCATDEHGNIVVVDEAYGALKTNQQQATEILRILERNSLKPSDCVIYADPSMFPPKDINKRIGKYPIEDYQENGLICVPAINDRLAGFSRIKQYLSFTNGFKILEGRAPNLIRTFPMQMPDKKDPEMLDTTGEDHALDSLRYAVMSRPPRAKNTIPGLNIGLERLQRGRQLGTSEIYTG